MRNIYQVLIKHKLNNHQYLQYTKNIRDAVASKLLAAIQQAAVRC